MDTGAGGGSYVSLRFYEAIRVVGGGSRSLKKGRGLLHAANPSDRTVPPMKVVGSSTVPFVFAPEERVRNVRDRIVEGLPYGCSLGARYLGEPKYIIILTGTRIANFTRRSVGPVRKSAKRFASHASILALSLASITETANPTSKYIDSVGPSARNFLTCGESQRNGLASGSDVHEDDEDGRTNPRDEKDDELNHSPVQSMEKRHEC